MTARRVQDQAIPNDVSMLSMQSGIRTPAVDLGERQSSHGTSQQYVMGYLPRRATCCERRRRVNLVCVRDVLSVHFDQHFHSGYISFDMDPQQW